MLQYLVILLDKSSVSYCHRNAPIEKQLIDIETLRSAIRYGMQENLTIQLVYPSYQLPQEYIQTIDTIDHVNILPLAFNGTLNDNPIQNIWVADEIVSPQEVQNKTVILRLPFQKVIEKAADIAALIGVAERLNICFTDLFDESLAEQYKAALALFSKEIEKYYNAGKRVNFNLLTDRLFLNQMNNCGAGVSNITIAPNGKFYICPAFYYDEIAQVDNKLNHLTPQYDRSVGDLKSGVEIANQHLLKLENAPICRICDAYHCHRCVWLNEQTTYDRNTPSHQQCVQSHLERNSSAQLLNRLKAAGYELDNEIKEIDYLDPFVIANQWK